MSKKIEVIELNLGIDPDELEKPILSAKAEEKIEKLVNLGIQEQEGLKKYHAKKEQEEEQKKSGAVVVYNKLSELASGGKEAGLTIADLANLYGSADIISTVVRVKNLIKERNGLWELKKSKVSGVTRYYFKATITETTD